MAALRIGVNALYLIPGGVGGTEIYLRQLLRSLAAIDRENRYVILTNTETGSDLVPDQPNFVRASQRVRAAVRPARIAWEQTLLPVAAARHKLDVLFNPGFTAPILCPCRQVTVFHDLQHKIHPEHFRWFDLPFWRVLLFGSAVISDRIIAVSPKTRDDLLAFYPRARIEVIEHGVDPRFFEIGRARRGGEPMVLCVSTLHPHKNLDRLIRAFAQFRRRRPGYTLVIAGLRGFIANELDALVRQLSLEKAVSLTGWIPREDLYSLFERAAAFIFPSTFEGFGMPVVEAMAAGLPAACSAIEPLIGVTNQAALLFDPSSVDAITHALERITGDDELRRRLGEAGPVRARAFTWEKAARATLKILESAAK